MLICLLVAASGCSKALPPLKLHWEEYILTISGDHLPAKEMKIWYLEAYCRDNSHTTHWGEHTVIEHETRLVSAIEDGTEIKLQCKVNDGLIVDHIITSTHDEVDIHIKAYNPTKERSEAHWAQPCVRVGEFTGTGPKQTEDKYANLEKSFVFLDGKLSRMPTRDWATEARYTPGQVWTGPGVPRVDVNPRHYIRMSRAMV